MTTGGDERQLNVSGQTEEHSRTHREDDGKSARAKDAAERAGDEREHAAAADETGSGCGKVRGSANESDARAEAVDDSEDDAK